MKTIVTLNGIDQAISSLHYNNENALKYRLINAIRKHYSDESSVGQVTEINIDDLVIQLWETGNNPSVIRNRKKNFNSIKSSINAELEKRYGDGENSEGVIIGPSNTFEMSAEAKNQILESFTYNNSGEQSVPMGQMVDVLKIINNMLESADSGQDADDIDVTPGLEQLKDIIRSVAQKVGVADSEGLEEGLVIGSAGEGDGPSSENENGNYEKTEDQSFMGGAGSQDADVPAGGGNEGGVDDAEELLEEEEVIEELEEDEDAEEIEDEPEDDDVEDLPEAEDVIEELEEDEDVEEIEDGLEGEDAEDLPEAGDVIEELEEVEDVEEIEDEPDEDEADLLEEEEVIEELEEDEDIEEVEDDEIVGLDDVNEGVGNEVTGESDELVADGSGNDVLQGDIDKGAGDGGIEDSDEETNSPEEFESAEEILEELDEEPDVIEEDLLEEDALEVELEEDEIEDEAEEDLEDVVIEEDIDDAEVEDGLEEADEKEDDFEEIPDYVDSDEDDHGDDLNEDVVEELDEDLEDLEEEDDDPDDLEVVDDIASPAAEDMDLDLDDVEVLTSSLEDLLDEYLESGYEGEKGIRKARLLAEAFNKSLATMDKYYNQYILIPEGTYSIGSSESENGLQKDKGVCLKEFYFGKFPVTNALFEMFIEKTGYITAAERVGYGTVYSGRYQKSINKETGMTTLDWSSALSSNVVEGACWYQPMGPGSTLHNKRSHPVVQVNREDAMAFAAWTGKRLPTEEEWEAASRTENGYMFPCGDILEGGICNMEDEYIGDTTPVDKYKEAANALGIVDVLGNIFEWTLSNANGSLEKGSGNAIYIAKGGSWISASNIDLSSRLEVEADFSSNILGFRCLAV